MKEISRIVVLSAFVLAAGLIGSADRVRASAHPDPQQGAGQQDQSSSENKSHLDQVNEHGDHVMGFDHTKTTHHFRLLADGGAIEVTANDINDTASRDQIRRHLTHIAMMFSSGDFSAPMLIHGQTPPGVEKMKKLKDDISYKFEETERCGRVRISTTKTDALSAVHEFLVFQIKDHQTGDSLEVEKQ